MVILQQHSQTGEYPKHISSARLSDPLEDLKACPQWVAWRWGPVRKGGKRGKIPINPSTRLRASVTKSVTWGTYQQALACAQEHGMGGVGFVFTGDDPYFGWDLDNCRDPETGVIHPAALALAARFGTYWEVSPSGTGIKGVGIGCKPKPPTEGKKPRCTSGDTPWGGKIELYDQRQYFTITEEPLGGRGSFVRDAQDVLDSVCLEFIPEPQKPVQPPVRTDTNHKRTLSERELLEKARNAKQLGPKFIALYDHGDLSWCGNDASRADNDLMSMLAYWTGHDRAWMESLFSGSALARRDKWTSRPDYRERTIDHAIKNTSKIYEPEKYSPREGSTNTRDKLEEIHHYARFVYRWTKIAGDSQKGARDRDALKVMLRAAWRANSLEIDMNGRDLMVAGGFGKRATAAKALTSLQDTHRWLVKVADAKGAKADRYRITPPADSKVDQALIRDTHPIGDQALIRDNYLTTTPPCEYQVLGPRLGKSVEIRNTSPISDKEYDKNGRRIVQSSKAPVSSVGKVAAWVLDLIHYYSRITGEPAPIGFLEERTNARRDHLKSRPIRKLIEARLILEVEGGYTTPEDVPERLDRELEDSGCNEKKRRQEEENAKDREISFIHRMRKAGADYDHIAAETGRSVAEIMDILKPPDEAPTYDDLDILKGRREIRNADGYIEDVQKADGFGYFPNPKSREPRLSSTAEVSKGNVPEDKHPLECDCLKCSITAPRYARPARTAPEAIREPLPERERELVPA
jgi:primase-polymerase (primpol)-like protein